MRHISSSLALNVLRVIAYNTEYTKATKKTSLSRQKAMFLLPVAVLQWPLGLKFFLFHEVALRLMLDGHFVNSPLRGSSFNAFDDFPVQNIKNVEIIRGPGS